MDEEQVTNEDPGLVLYRGCYSKRLGSVQAALLLSQIHYWYSADQYGKSRIRIYKYGFWWIAKSAQEWADECSLSYKQARDALELLVLRGVVVRERFRFNNLATTHIRLSMVEGRGPVPEGWLIPISPALPQGPLTAALEGNASTAPGGIALTETTTKTKTETKSSGTHYVGTPGKQFSGEKNPGKKEEKEKNEEKSPEFFPTQKESTMKPSGPIQHKTSAEIWAKLEEKKGEPVQVSPAMDMLAKELAHLWAQLLIQHGDAKFVPVPTLKELGQFGQYRKKCLANKIPPAVVMASVVKHWHTFTLRVRESLGTNQCPVSPLLGYLLTHFGIAVDLWVGTQSPANMITPVKQQPKAPVKTVVKEPEPEEPFAEGLTPQEWYEKYVAPHKKGMSYDKKTPVFGSKKSEESKLATPESLGPASA